MAIAANAAHLSESIQSGNGMSQPRRDAGRCPRTRAPLPPLRWGEFVATVAPLQGPGSRAVVSQSVNKSPIHKMTVGHKRSTSSRCRETERDGGARGRRAAPAIIAFRLFPLEQKSKKSDRARSGGGIIWQIAGQYRYVLRCLDDDSMLPFFNCAIK